MKNLTLLILIFLNSICSFAATSQKISLDSRQLIVVVTPNWDSINGEAYLFNRDSSQLTWKAVGKPIPVVVGKHGLGWDFHLQNNKNNIPIKHEGDGKTPIGIYQIGLIFGFEKKNIKNYLQLSDASVCVDDIKSTYYNQLIDSTHVTKKDWDSAEQMRQVPQYKAGAFIQYNTSPIQPGAGSCIFIHIWKGPKLGTAGCIAMEESHLKTILDWLNTSQKPTIAILPISMYKDLKSKWDLP